MVPRQTVAINGERQFIRGLHAVVAIATLMACVLLAHDLLNSSVSWMVGAAIAYPVSKVVGRLALPQSEPLTDEERLRLIPLPIWLVVALMCVTLMHYGTRLGWLWSTVVVAIGEGILLAVELRQRSQAKTRLAADNLR